MNTINTTSDPATAVVTIHKVRMRDLPSSMHTISVTEIDTKVKEMQNNEQGMTLGLISANFKQNNKF